MVRAEAASPSALGPHGGNSRGRVLEQAGLSLTLQSRTGQAQLPRGQGRWGTSDSHRQTALVRLRRLPKGSLQAPRQQSCTVSVPRAARLRPRPRSSQSRFLLSSACSRPPPECPAVAGHLGVPSHPPPPSSLIGPSLHVVCPQTSHFMRTPAAWDPGVPQTPFQLGCLHEDPQKATSRALGSVRHTGVRGSVWTWSRGCVFRAELRVAGTAGHTRTPGLTRPGSTGMSWSVKYTD